MTHPALTKAASRLIKLGAYRGASQILFCAALQSKPLQQLTPDGPLPMRRAA